jgi:hypothetical protein
MLEKDLLLPDASPVSSDEEPSSLTVLEGFDGIGRIDRPAQVLGGPDKLAEMVVGEDFGEFRLEVGGHRARIPATRGVWT